MVRLVLSVRCAEREIRIVRGPQGNKERW